MDALGLDSTAWPGEDWAEATPEDVGFASSFRDGLHEYARDSSPQITSVLIVRHGYLVFEEYFGGFSHESYFSINSATKSVTSALVGIALRDGLLTSLDETLPELFPEHADLLSDRQKSQISVRHLLTMTSGFAYDRTKGIVPFDSRDVVRTALERPLVSDPGSAFFYDDLTLHLLSAVIARRSGMSLAAYAEKELFEPIGIWQGERRVWDSADGGAHMLSQAGRWPDDGVAWKVDQHGNNYAGFGLHMTARDMARFGYLYLRSGAWNGRQIVPGDYVEASTRVQNAGGQPVNISYGYLWWIPAEGRHFMASGFGGQVISVLTLRDLVLTYTTSPARNPGDAIVRRFIRPSFE